IYWTPILPVTAISLTSIVVAHIVTSYTSAYLAAPHEIGTYVDAVESSIQENESYDSDVSKVQRLEDKLRLGRLLREIQKSSDDLREDLNRLVIAENSTTLRTSARVLWVNHRRQLEERVRRLDLLRMRFLVLYMGIVAGTAENRPKIAEKTMSPHNQHQTPRPLLPRGLTDSIKQRPPLRRITTAQSTPPTPPTPPPPPPYPLTPMTPHSSNTQHQRGWRGVVQELQSSPMMHRRRTSIEQSTRSPPTITP
ncbi:hypothetical protein M426DRAFT_43472, partial [Hypoxylon sp. CI-4A]